MTLPTIARWGKLSSDDDESSKYKLPNLIASAVVSLLLIGIAKIWFPTVVPFEFWGFWGIRGSFMDWIGGYWFIFAWGMGLSLLFTPAQFRLLKEAKRRSFRAPSTGEVFKNGVITSVLAGVLEEILFRWIFFLGGLIGICFTNWCFFGVLGFGIPEFLYNLIVGPVANFMTGGILEQHLLHMPWHIGSGIIAANTFFRDGHKYQGPIGWVNSWFMGMFLFSVFFEFGLVAAIVLHFLYDFMLDLKTTIVYAIA